MSGPQPEVLTSWKEIATYFGAGVRTVQRYERQFGLPVRRFNGRNRSTVRAYPDELDAWLRSRARGSAPPEGRNLENWNDALSRFNVIMTNIYKSLGENQRLREESLYWCRGLGHSIRVLHGSVRKIDLQKGS
jgi:phage terminase Nu1 subunit (DNA packaging protein)